MTQIEFVMKQLEWLKSEYVKTDETDVKSAIVYAIKEITQTVIDKELLPRYAPK